MTKKSTIWGDLAYLSLVPALFLVAVLCLRSLGWLPPMSRLDHLIVGGAVLAATLTTVFALASSDGPSFHRLGFDLCSLTFGSCLALLVAQLASDRPALPRLGNAMLGTTLSASQQVAVVALLGFGSVAGLAVTAHIVRAVDQVGNRAKPRYPGLLCAGSLMVGAALILMYVLVLLGAGI